MNNDHDMDRIEAMVLAHDSGRHAGMGTYWNDHGCELCCAEPELSAAAKGLVLDDGDLGGCVREEAE